MEFVQLVILRLNSTTTCINVVIVNKVTKKHQDKVVKANVFLFVQSMKIIS